MKKKISRNQIQRIYSSGKKIKSEIFILFWELSYDKLNDSVAVISIPKNKIKKAVDRNRLKRRIKESLSIKSELAYSILDLKINFILIYNKKTVLNFKQINKDLVNLFGKLLIKVNESI